MTDEVVKENVTLDYAEDDDVEVVETKKRKIQNVTPDGDDEKDKEEAGARNEPRRIRWRRKRTIIPGNAFRLSHRLCKFRITIYCDYRMKIRGAKILPYPPIYSARCMETSMRITLDSRVRLALAMMSPKREFASEFSLQYLLDRTVPKGKLNSLLDLLTVRGATLEPHYVKRQSSTERKLLRGHFRLIPSSFQLYESFDAQAIRNQLENHGPLVIIFEIKNDFDFSGKEIYRCKGEPLDDREVEYHAVVLVAEAKSHWIYRNCWGLQFGYMGYGFIAKEAEFVALAPMLDAEQLKALPWKPA